MKYKWIILSMIAAGACQGGGSGPGPGKEAAPGERTGTSIQALEMGKGWKRLNPVGPFMTSPAWLPGGSGIVAFGWKGLGLYAANTRSGQIEDLGAALRPPLVWSDDRKSFCAREGKGSARFGYDIESGKIKPVGSLSEECRIKPGPGESEITLHDKDGLTVIQDEKTSSLKILHQGKETLVEGHGAWGVAVSPDGKKIAYSTGPLKESNLHIYDLVKGKTSVGRGAGPSWFPGSKSLVYAVPETDIAPSGEARIVRSELYVYDVDSSSSLRITDTHDAIEMQPAVSPSGDSVAFSDWKGGGLFIMPAGKEAGK